MDANLGYQGVVYRTMYGFSQGLSEDDKEKIVKEFLPFIKYTANRMSWRVPPQLTVEDLISAGLMGLLDAMEKFEPGRVQLKTYAEKRIRGAMLDELRNSDWLPRSAKKRVDDLRGAIGKLERELGRQPEDEEVAQELGITLDEYFSILAEARGAVNLRFEDFAETNEGLDIMETIADKNAANALSSLIDEDSRDVLARLITSLPEKEKLVLSLYYWEELTLKEIGKVLDVTESRICQLHSKALLTLKAKLLAERD